MKLKYTYDVVISFADEQKDIAAAIQDFLALWGVTCYHYPHEPGQNWGRDLERSLRRTYLHGGQLGLAIVSADYFNPAKRFTPIEWEALRLRNEVDGGNDFLLTLNVRMPHADLQTHMPAGLTWLDWNSNAREVAELILEKLRQHGWEPTKSTITPLPHLPATQRQTIQGDGNLQVGGNLSAGGDVTIQKG
jgi:hypothetical protein